jgi:hypothetical protein
MPIEFDAQGRRAGTRKKLLPLQVKARDVEEWIVAKEPTAIGGWRELGAEEYARSFTAAQTAGTDLAEDLYFALVDTFARTGTESDFAALVMPTLKAKGWLGGDEGQIATRVALIYDTNLRLARAAGRWTHYQASKGALPYLRAFTVADDRVRHPPKSPETDHRAWQDIILPVDHPFWRVYWPPLGFRCRCGIMQLSRSALARYRGGITTEEELEERKARLGPPLFLAPGVSIGAQLTAMTDASNRRERGSMPGLRAVDPRETERKGRDVWDAVLAAQSYDDIGRQLDGLFRRAA